jgi:hypothetical protein
MKEEVYADGRFETLQARLTALGNEKKTSVLDIASPIAYRVIKCYICDYCFSC